MGCFLTVLMITVNVILIYLSITQSLSHSISLSLSISNKFNSPGPPSSSRPFAQSFPRSLIPSFVCLCLCAAELRTHPFSGDFLSSGPFHVARRTPGRRPKHKAKHAEIYGDNSLITITPDRHTLDFTGSLAEREGSALRKHITICTPPLQRIFKR